MSERNDKQCMRNWSLKAIAGFSAHLDKIVAACPEVEAEMYRLKHNLSEMDKVIREHQPPSPDLLPRSRPMKRIVVR